MKQRRTQAWIAWIAWIAAGLLAGIVFLPLCDLNFDCGCVWPGRGGADHCDIRVAGPPDCPWCDHPSTAAIAVLVSYGAGLFAAMRLARRGSLLLTTSGCFAVLIVSIMLCGVATSLLTGRTPLAGLI